MALVLRRKLILRCFTSSGSRGVPAAACEDAAPATTIASAAGLVQPQGSRYFSVGPSYWDATTPARRELYTDLATAKQFLPNRSSFTPQFTAHGFQLIPESLANAPTVEAQAQQQTIEAAAVAAATVAAQQAAAAALQAASQQPHGPEGLQLDSVKRKRRLAMKKHKYKKRMRKQRGSSS